MMALRGLLLALLAASSAVAAESQPPKPTPPKSTLTEQYVRSSSRQAFRRCLDAGRELDKARAAYAEGSGSLTALYQAQQRLTAAEIAYATVSASVRGNPQLRDYLARRAEVAALERAQADVVAIDVAEGEKELYREELIRYEESLKLARSQLAAAERLWKTAERGEQFRYLNRRATFDR